MPRRAPRPHFPYKEAQPASTIRQDQRLLLCLVCALNRGVVSCRPSPPCSCSPPPPNSTRSLGLLPSPTLLPPGLLHQGTMRALRSRIFAAYYDTVTGRMEKEVFAALRLSVLRAATGRVLEVGAGTGNSLEHYAALAAEAAAADSDSATAKARVATSAVDMGDCSPPPPPYTRLVMVEPNPHMRRQLQAKVDELEPSAPSFVARVEVADGGFPHLPYPDASFDTIVLFLVLCSVPDVTAAVSEVRRLLAPGGRVLLVEHLAAGDEKPTVAAWQARLAGLCKIVGDGCHLRRDVVAALAKGGFDVGGVDERSWTGKGFWPDLFLARVGAGQAVVRKKGTGKEEGKEEREMKEEGL